MYHYVREHNIDLPHFNFLHINDFKKQLDHFQANYNFLSKDEFISSINKQETPKNSIVLTFDDGLRDHYKYVLPELKKRRLWGIFYIPTLPYTKQQLLHVHRIHMLLGKFPAEKIYSAINNLIDPQIISKAHQEKFSKKLYLKQDNNGTAQKVKELLNYYIDYSYRDQLLDQLMQQFFPNEKALAKDFYMTTSELQKMQDEGMIIGSHAVSHSVMSKLSLQDQKMEIQNSFSFLQNNLTPTDFKTFCYPYGGFHTFSNETEILLTKENVVCSFNVESRDITLQDIKERPQALPRYDCNEFPYGQIYRS